MILAIMAAEFVWLTHREKWRWSAAALLLVPGALMLLALRGALTGLGWGWIAVLLALSFPVHLADIARRRAEK